MSLIVHPNLPGHGCGHGVIYFPLFKGKIKHSHLSDKQVVDPRSQAPRLGEEALSFLFTFQRDRWGLLGKTFVVVKQARGLLFERFTSISKGQNLQVF